MKRSFAALFALCILLAGCGKTPDGEAPSTGNTDNQEPKRLPMVAVSLPAKTQTTKANDGNDLFRYTFQNISMVHPYPEVANKIIVDFLNRADKADRTAANIYNAAVAAYTGSAGWTPYLYHNTYDVQRVDQSVLSIAGTSVEYTGAAHAEQTCMNANYNMITGEVLYLDDILIEGQSSLPQLAIAALDKIQVEKRLYDGYEDTVILRFNQDLTADEDWYFSNAGLCFPFAPYDLAPYSSGVIVAEIPYEQLLGILKDAYFPAEADSYNGNLSSMTFTPEKASGFEHMAELILGEEGQMLILYTDETVDQISILVADTAKEDVPYIAFAAQQLKPEDAIILQLPAEDTPNITVSYRSNGTIITYQIP